MENDTNADTVRDAAARRPRPARGRRRPGVANRALAQTDIAVAQALLAQKAEIDRLRDLVRRMADALDTFPAIEDHEIDLLREAREALGEGEP